MFKDLILHDPSRRLHSEIEFTKVIFSNIFSHKKTDLFLVKGNQYNRDILENKSVRILVSPEHNIVKDSLHFRNSGLNQVLCKIARRNGVIIGFSFNELLNSKDRPLVLGKMMQNVKLCRKFRVKTLIASFANNDYEMRSFDTLRAFGLVIGMTPFEVKKSLDIFSTLKLQK